MDSRNAGVIQYYRLQTHHSIPHCRSLLSEDPHQHVGLRKKFEVSLKREDCTDDQRRITTAHIQLIMLAEAEADGTAPAVQS